MSPEDFRAWMQRHRFSQPAAAARLGRSPRQIWAYAHGQATIDLTLRLAMAAIDRGLTDYAS